MQSTTRRAPINLDIRQFRFPNTQFVTCLPACLIGDHRLEANRPLALESLLQQPIVVIFKLP